MDRRWGFIRQHAVTAANVHDSRHFETILDPGNTGRTIRADSAYADRARLTQQGGKCLRTIGLVRATVVIGLKVASHNLMRLARLQHRSVVPA